MEPVTRVRAAELRENLIQFLKDNMTEVCVEIMEWDNTGILRDGKFRYAARMWDELEHNHATQLSIAKSFVFTLLMQERISKAA